MFIRKPYDELDNALAKLDAFIRLISHLQDQEFEDRRQLQESEGFLVEAMIAESHRARRAFDRTWSLVAANDRRVS